MTNNMNGGTAGGKRGPALEKLALALPLLTLLTLLIPANYSLKPANRRPLIANLAVFFGLTGGAA